MPAKSESDNPQPTGKSELNSPPSIDITAALETGSPPPTDKDELSSFREDYRQLEDDIQSYFRAYYLSGIAGFLAWMLGTKSNSAGEMLIGNGGHNIYALMAIGLLNMVTTTFLIYKGMAVHEIAQFMYKESESDSAFRKWEKWRRGPDSVARPYRKVYSFLLIAVPLATSTSILWILGKVLFTTREPQLAGVFGTAKWFFGFLVVLHVIPGRLAYVSAKHIPKSWDKFI